MLDNLLSSVEAFHLLRPIWALCFPVILLVWWKVRQRDESRDTHQSGIARHLADAMTLKQTGAGRWRPIDTTALALLLLVFAACGPTWSRVPSPFQSQTAPMVVVMELTRSMESPDLQPSRLERAKFKVLDLIERRAGARTAVIVYAGSAHRLAPLTEDPEILRSMLDALSAEIMPIEGNKLRPALEMAQMELVASATPGTILLVTDGVEAADLSALEGGKEKPPLVLLFAAPEGEALDTLEQSPASGIVRLTADDADLDRIQRHANSAYQSASLGNDKLEWEDRGWIFAWLGALLMALWFRKGWTVHWALLVCGILPGLLTPSPAHADVTDWFLTKDQQATLAYDVQDFTAAADTFQDPMWRAQSLIRMGKFEEAADIFSRIDTPEAAFGEGYCWQKAQRFRQSVRAYERALALRPDYPDAEHNLVLARAIAKLVDPGRKQETEGDQRGGGNGNPEDFGDTKLTSTNQMSASAQAEFSTTEEWMRAVDTEMSEFLKARFEMEARELAQ